MQEENEQSGERDPLYVEVGERVRLFRQKLKMSQGEFAERTGISQKRVSMYELGDRCPSLRFLVSLGKMGVDLNEILGIRSARSIPEQKKGGSITEGMVRVAAEFVDEQDGRPPNRERAVRIAQLSRTIADGAQKGWDLHG